jgi:hypothetical protein
MLTSKETNMKQYLVIISALLVFLAAGCKKDKDMVSQVVDVSYPTITLDGVSLTGISNEDYYLESIGFDQTGFISLTPGQSLPAATAYDSLHGTTVNVNEYANTGFDPNVPGLYLIDYVANNQYGYYTLARYYTAVTDVDESADLSGIYYGIIDGDTLSDAVEIVEVANGLYLHFDLTGDQLGLAGAFVHFADNTIEFSSQPDLSHQLSGPFNSTNGMVDTTGGETVITYEIENDEVNDMYGEGTVFRFVRQ